MIIVLLWYHVVKKIKKTLWHFVCCTSQLRGSLTAKLTRQPISLATNFARCKMFGLAQENARARWSALNALFGYFKHLMGCWLCFFVIILLIDNLIHGVIFLAIPVILLWRQLVFFSLVPIVELKKG